MAKLGKFVLASRIAKRIIAEDAKKRLAECDFQKPELIEPEDPQLKELRKEHPADVKDETEAAKGVSKPKEETPKGKGPLKSPSDKDLKPKKYTDMTNYVPANIKRADKTEVPTVSFDFDDSELEPEEEKDLEDYFDKKHIIKLKETIGGGSRAALDRLNQKTPGHPNFRGPAPVKNGVTDYSPKPLSNTPPKEKPKNEFFKPAPINQQHMFSQGKTKEDNFWAEANQIMPYDGQKAKKPKASDKKKITKKAKKK